MKKVTRMEKARQVLAKHPELFGEETQKALWDLFKKAIGQNRQGKLLILREIANLLLVPNEERQDDSDLWQVCSGVRDLVVAKNRLDQSGIAPGDKVTRYGEGPYVVKSISKAYFLILEGQKGGFSPSESGIEKVG